MKFVCITGSRDDGTGFYCRACSEEREAWIQKYFADVGVKCSGCAAVVVRGAEDGWKTDPIDAMREAVDA